MTFGHDPQHSPCGLYCLLVYLLAVLPPGAHHVLVVPIRMGFVSSSDLYITTYNSVVVIYLVLDVLAKISS